MSSAERGQVVRLNLANIAGADNMSALLSDSFNCTLVFLAFFYGLARLRSDGRTRASSTRFKAVADLVEPGIARIVASWLKPCLELKERWGFLLMFQ